MFNGTSICLYEPFSLKWLNSLHAHRSVSHRSLEILIFHREFKIPSNQDDARCANSITPCKLTIQKPFRLKINVSASMYSSRLYLENQRWKEIHNKNKIKKKKIKKKTKMKTEAESQVITWPSHKWFSYLLLHLLIYPLLPVVHSWPYQTGPSLFKRGVLMMVNAVAFKPKSRTLFIINHLRVLPIFPRNPQKQYSWCTDFYMVEGEN